MSGLKVNPAKSTCFLANVPASVATDILHLLQFEQGTYPARFLGVPLITSKLSIADCQPLLERIKKRLLSWTTKFLSFAGRMLLIKSVIFAMQAYWTTFFFLPTTVIREIQSYMSRFLWKASITDPYGARIAWTKVSLPKDEGGLGIKDLREWNRALIIQQLLKVVNWEDHSIWASWIRHYVIKDQPFWILKPPSDCSWIWRKVLSLRSTAIPFVNFKIGNGSQISLWFDPWCHNHTLVSSVSHSLINNSGLGKQAKLCSIIHNGAWSLPTSNHMDVIQFRRDFLYSTPMNPTAPDLILWQDCNLSSVKAIHIWKSIRMQRPLVPWAPLAWNKLTPPRFAFLTWSAHHHSFRTKDRLLSFGLSVDPTCVLCGIANESFRHLFFDCSFSYQILIMTLRKYGWRGTSRYWDVISAGLMAQQPLNFRKQVQCYALSLVLYYIWKERNNRLFQSSHIGTRPIVRFISTLITDRMRTWHKLRTRFRRVHPAFSQQNMPNVVH